MEKKILRSKPITLLIATLFMMMVVQLPLYADANQFLFNMDAIKDPGSLAVKIQDSRAAVSQSIVWQLSEDTQSLLIGYDGANSPSPELQKALLADLNRLIQTGSLYNAQVFTNIQLSEQTQAHIAQNPQDGEALVVLNRLLLADAYPYELASPLEEQPSQDSKGIEVCRENLRQIKLARDNYRDSNADTDPRWLSDLSPQYLDKKRLLCPADKTAGDPGVLTEGATDPTLPCSYLYESRAPEKIHQDTLLIHEGGMTPIVRCEHHLLNLSISGMLYRNGPQRGIYSSNKTELSMLRDIVRGIRAQHGEEFLKTQAGRVQLKQATEELIHNILVPKILSTLENDVASQLEEQLGKGLLNTPMGMDIYKQALGQVKSTITEQIQVQLQDQLGEEFFKTEEGQDLLKQLSVLMSP